MKIHSLNESFDRKFEKLYTTNESKETVTEDISDIKTYKVTVNFGGYVGSENDYEVSAENEDEAYDLAIDDAADDLTIEDINQIDENTFEVEVGFAGELGVSEIYEVDAYDEDEATEAALFLAKDDLNVDEIVELTDLEDLDESCKDTKAEEKSDKDEKDKEELHKDNDDKEVLTELEEDKSVKQFKVDYVNKDDKSATDTVKAQNVKDARKQVKPRAQRIISVKEVNESMAKARRRYVVEQRMKARKARRIQESIRKARSLRHITEGSSKYAVRKMRNR